MTRPYPELAFAFTCLAITVVLVVIGLLLRRRGILTGKWPALGWALLCGIPLLLSIGHAYSQKGPGPAPRSAASQIG